MAVDQAPTIGAAIAAVSIDDVRIHYKSRKRDGVTAVDGASFSLEPGEFVALVGPSGCGKSSLLMAIAGLVPIDGGRIAIRCTADGDAAGRAPFSVVFQQDRLLPWLTARGNVVLAMEAAGLPRTRWREVADRELTRVGLQGFEDAYPNQLSGGMQQRVNLARALAVNPQVLLLDEPFASLDALTREVMQLELLRIWNQERNTALFVTHQVDEAVYLADRVVVLTSRPARVKTVVDVPFERPRSLELKRSVDFLEVTDEVWSNLDLGVGPAGTGAPMDGDPRDGHQGEEGA